MNKKKKWAWEKRARNCIQDLFRFLIISLTSAMLWLGSTSYNALVDATLFQRWIFLGFALIYLGFLLYAILNFRFGNMFQIMGALTVIVAGISVNPSLFILSYRLYAFGLIIRILSIVGFSIKSKFYFRGKKI